MERLSSRPTPLRQPGDLGGPPCSYARLCRKEARTRGFARSAFRLACPCRGANQPTPARCRCPGRADTSTLSQPVSGCLEGLASASGSRPTGGRRSGPGIGSDSTGPRRRGQARTAGSSAEDPFQPTALEQRSVHHKCTCDLGYHSWIFQADLDGLDDPCRIAVRRLIMAGRSMTSRGFS